MDRTTPSNARPANEPLPNPIQTGDPVERILAECLAFSGDPRQRIDEACLRHPEHAQELRERLRLLYEVGFLGESGPDASPIPERLGGFELIRRIGSGGMGVVYLAREEALGRTVALKLVRPEHLFFPESLERFRREVKAVAGLRHPGIVPVFSVGEAQGIPFFAMEWVAGANLQQVLGRLAEQPAARLTGRDFSRALAEVVSDAGATSPEEVLRRREDYRQLVIGLTSRDAEAK